MFWTKKEPVAWDPTSDIEQRLKMGCITIAIAHGSFWRGYRFNGEKSRVEKFNPVILEYCLGKLNGVLHFDLEKPQQIRTTINFFKTERANESLGELQIARWIVNKNWSPLTVRSSQIHPTYEIFIDINDNDEEIFRSLQHAMRDANRSALRFLHIKIGFEKTDIQIPEPTNVRRTSVKITNITWQNEITLKNAPAWSWNWLKD